MSRASDFPIPLAMRQYYTDLDAAGAAAVQGTEWWQQLKEGQQWVEGWPSRPNDLEGVGLQHRGTAPLHYVMGQLSPFYIERMFQKDRTRAVWAVYFGPYTSNGTAKMGVGQGGAIASIFDLVTAQMSMLYVQQPTPTTELSVRLRRPTTPIPGVFRVDVWIEKDEGSRVYVKAELSDGSGNKPLALCSATLARVSNRGVKKGKAKL